MARLRVRRKIDNSVLLGRKKRLLKYKSILANKNNTVDNDTIDTLTMQKFTARIKRENKERLQKNIPIAKYDIVSRRAYLEYADGRREYVDQT